jgi:hypothetical protein
MKKKKIIKRYRKSEKNHSDIQPSTPAVDKGVEIAKKQRHLQKKKK